MNLFVFIKLISVMLAENWPSGIKTRFAPLNDDSNVLQMAVAPEPILKSFSLVSFASDVDQM